MKKYVILLLLLSCMTMPAVAQHRHQSYGKKHRREITELISDLSNAQKRKIEAISKASKERVGELRLAKKAVCDSIATYIEMDDDQTQRLERLFVREAVLQVEINKEMYATKRKIDAVLTAEQRAELWAMLKKSER